MWQIEMEVRKKMKEILSENINIENMIYEIRGKQVMLDSDLAKLYQCKNGTKTINQAVQRHIERFPDDFYFELTLAEYRNFLRSQLGTSNLQSVEKGGRRYLPCVFTEQGVAMLSTVLRTDIASEVSISIMRAFVSMRKYFSSNLIEQRYIYNQVLKNTEDIKLLQESFKKIEEKKVVNEIYFNGQIYDAYSKILDIVKEAKSELIIIDAYTDKSILDIIRNLNCDVTLITKKKNSISQTEVRKYSQQYANLKVIYDNTFHDRYFILDESKIYHCGTSINHAGSKTFSINLLEDELVKSALIEKANHIIDSQSALTIS